jgi:hypothetical protein
MNLFSLVLIPFFLTAGPGIPREKAPDVSGMPLMSRQDGSCPDGAKLEMFLYDPDPTNPDALVITWFIDGNLAVAQVKPGDMVWVEAHKKYYTLDEALSQWAKICDIPRPAKGVGI